MDETWSSSTNIRALRVRVRVTGALGFTGPHNNVTHFYNTSSPLWRHDHTPMMSWPHPYDVMTPMTSFHENLIDRSHDLLLHADWSICTTWPKCGFLIGLYRSGPPYYFGASLFKLIQQIYYSLQTASSLFLILAIRSFLYIRSICYVGFKTY